MSNGPLGTVGIRLLGSLVGALRHHGVLIAPYSSYSKLFDSSNVSRTSLTGFTLGTQRQQDGEELDPADRRDRTSAEEAHLRV